MRDQSQLVEAVMAGEEAVAKHFGAWHACRIRKSLRATLGRRNERGERFMQAGSAGARQVQKDQPGRRCHSRAAAVGLTQLGCRSQRLVWKDTGCMRDAVGFIKLGQGEKPV